MRVCALVSFASRRGPISISCLLSFAALDDRFSFRFIEPCEPQTCLFFDVLMMIMSYYFFDFNKKQTSTL